MAIEITVTLAMVAAKAPLRALADVALRGRRRIHALGVFYNFTGEDTDNAASEWKTCPHCGAELTRLPGTARIETLIKEGRTFVGIRHPERRQTWVN